MTMADVLAITFVHLGIILVLTGQWLLLRALFPAAVGRSRDRVLARPFLSFLVGIPPALLLALALGMASKGGPPAKALGLLLFTGTFLLAGVGLGGLATAVGDRLPSPADAGRPWRGLVRGALCLELAFFLPLVGWFVLFPLAAVTSLGAATLAAFSGRAAPAGTAAAAPGGAAA